MHNTRPTLPTGPRRAELVNYFNRFSSMVGLLPAKYHVKNASKFTVKNLNHRKGRCIISSILFTIVNPILKDATEQFISIDLHILRP